MIKAICFDLDGVFFTKEGMESFVQSLIAKGSSENAVRNAVFKSEEMKQFKMGLISEEAYVTFLQKALQIPLTSDEFRELLQKDYKINAEVLEYVRAAKTKGYITCICSNNFSTRIEILNQKFDFLKEFDVKILSYQVGVLKPNKEIFQRLIEVSGVEASEIVYSDDSQEKLAGAIELGITAFVYEDFEQFKNTLIQKGVVV